MNAPCTCCTRPTHHSVPFRGCGIWCDECRREYLQFEQQPDPRLGMLIGRWLKFRRPHP